MARLTQALETANVPYMICGSVASFFHGVPRTTQDVDLVVQLTGFDVPRLLQCLPDDDFYVSESAALDAVRSQRQFNVIDMQTGWKADLIIKKRRPFSRLEFDRRVKVALMGVEVWVASAEDTVLSKLEWASAAGSERQIRDAAGIVQVRGDGLDVAYLREWAAELGVSTVLEELLAS
jgi:hypothetical protein